ncbi:Succinate dehydrogenase assembly factor 1, mitochondrial [Metarhizium anisopliae]|nr:Succinate dehydrogenase assembly factor 1, mitochondrial [Metarhizium anisopliae]
MRLSGLQKEVLALYRSCLRESRKKPATLDAVAQALLLTHERALELISSNSRGRCTAKKHCIHGCKYIPNTLFVIRAEFDRNLRIEKRDFAAIEFLLRKGRRQLDVYSNPGIKDVR